MKNFGLIKNAFANLIAEGIAEKDDAKKKAFKKYIKEIRNNDVLKSEFYVYSNLENASEEDRHKTYEYIKENISCLEGYTKKQLNEANNKLVGILKKATKSPKKYLNEQKIDENLKDLYSSITDLVHSKKDPRKLNERAEKIDNIISFVNNKKPNIEESSNKEPIPNNVLINFTIDKFNKKYSDLSESEKKVVKSFIEEDEDAKKESFKELKNETIDLIDNKLEEQNLDVNIKDKLVESKRKLVNMEPDEKLEENIRQITDLKEVLV